MGYFTKYEVNIVGEDAEEALLGLEIESGISMEDLEEDVVKWYGCLKDCKKVSTMFPNVDIYVCGNGEEVPDLWRAHIKNGALTYQRGTVVFSEVLDNEGNTILPYDEFLCDGSGISNP